MGHPFRRIYINANFLRQPTTGVQRYGKELLDQFDQLLCDDAFYSDVELVCLTPAGLNIPNPWKRIQLRSSGSNSHHIWEQLILPFLIGSGLLFSPSNLGPILVRRQITTLHDASIYAVPEAYTTLFKTHYRVVLALLSRSIRGFFTDSEFSRSEISKYLPSAANKISTIPLGGDHLAKVTPDFDAFAKLGLLPQGYYLLVGSRSKHKNTAMVYQALDSMGFTGTLVHIGGAFSNVFEDHGTHQPQFNVVDPGYVSDGLLRALYQNAKALIFPSIYEGFGFPPLEAMLEGCPVIASNAASIPEVVGDAALSFDPYDQPSLIARINELEESPALRDELIQKGKRRAAEFTWQRAARQTLDKLLTYL